MTPRDRRRVRGPAGEIDPRYYTPGEVAALLRVDPRTVTRWALAGKIRSVRTPGNHRRYLRGDIDAYLSGES